MQQPYLDMMNYEPEGPKGDYLDWLCTAPKTVGRLGFVPGSRFEQGAYFFAGITPYGMRCMESHYIKLLCDFGEFNYEILKRLCESPLPDAVVLNIIDNALNYKLEEEPCEKADTYVAWLVAYQALYKDEPENNGWRACGCHCFINGRKYSLEVLDLLHTTGRVKILPLSTRFVPRDEDLKDFTWHPHPAAYDKNGNSLWEKGIKTISLMIALQRIFA